LQQAAELPLVRQYFEARAGGRHVAPDAVTAPVPGGVATGTPMNIETGS
jgi:hypothetical protein